jgi:hypothetical protein
MERIVMFGTGSCAKKVLKSIDYNKYHIVAFVDNNSSRHDSLFMGIDVRNPDILFSLNYDKIVICSSTYFKAIKKQLLEDYSVKLDRIENKFYFIKNQIIDYYKKQININDEIKEVLNYLKDNNLDVFNYKFTTKYDDYKIDVNFDNTVNMFYVIHNGKKMFFKRSFHSVEQVIQYYKFLCQEQDIDSPHRYIVPGMEVEKGDIVIDAGVAEGNFALDNIEKVSKIYLIESDKEWIQALKETFKYYPDKVVIVEKYLSNNDNENNITIDKLITNDKINYIKMDIEGEEINALQGARETLIKNDRIKINICTYHNVNDEKIISDCLKQLDYKVNVSSGYMFFVNDTIYESKEPRLVRGLLRGFKDTTIMYGDES